MERTKDLELLQNASLEALSSGNEGLAKFFLFFVGRLALHEKRIINVDEEDDSLHLLQGGGPLPDVVPHET